MRSLFRILPMIGMLLCSLSLYAQPQDSYSASDIELMLKKANVVGKVLYVAAHPDDENTRLLSYLANESCVQTAYVSLTRGDGGQNLLGTDIGPYLGLIRSYELMAARSVDRAQQFFTRAYDFGYSKSPEETFNIWDKDAVLEDLVYIIRYFKPDLVITRFATDGSGGHGHHTASALLAEEAFDAAADTKTFPHQLKHLQPWKAHALLYNNAARFRNPNADMTGNVEVAVGGYNPLLGRSYGEIAGLSRSMHKSQGFGSRNSKGEIYEYFLPLKGHPVKTGLFDGMNISLKRLKGSEIFEAALQKAIHNFKPSQPEIIIPDLIEAYKATQHIQDAHWRQIKKSEIENLLIAVTGTWLEVAADQPTVTRGENLPIQTFAINRSNASIVLNKVALNGNTLIEEGYPLAKNMPLEQKSKFDIPKDQAITGPYWLAKSPENGIFQLDDLTLLNAPVNYGNIEASFDLTIEDLRITVKRPLLYRWVDPVKGESYRALEIIPEVMANFTEKVLVFSDQKSKTCKVILKAGKDQVTGNLLLLFDGDYTVEPAIHSFTIDKKNQEITLSFEVTPGAMRGLSTLKAIVEVDGQQLDRSLVEIKYDHIPIQMVFPEAKISLSNIDLSKKEGRIAYIPGAGDEVAEGLRQIGYQVVEVTEDAISKTDLSQFKAIITGVRAFNTNERLYAQVAKINEYVSNGGTFIVQYNTNSWAGPLKGMFGPYPFDITRNRVTDEDATVSFQVPNHRVLNYPNKISQVDFEGWVQERGLYFAGNWSEEFVAPLSMADPGEKQDLGSLIIAPYGNGYFTYTGLSFFRQIPNGTPGAYRLLTNLIELGTIQP